MQSKSIGSMTSSLAGARHHLRRFGHWIVHRNWMKLLKMAKLVIEIIRETRNLLFCMQSGTVNVRPG